jgi:hypothetical protein
VLAHVAGIPVEEALMVAPALLAGLTMIIGYVRATAARIRVKGHERRGPRHQKTTMPKSLLLKRRARAPARARRDEPARRYGICRSRPPPHERHRVRPRSPAGPPTLGSAEL